MNPVVKMDLEVRVNVAALSILSDFSRLVLEDTTRAFYYSCRASFMTMKESLKALASSLSRAQMLKFVFNSVPERILFLDLLSM